MRAPFFGLHCWKLTQDSGMPYNEKNKSFAARLCLSYSEVPYTNKIDLLQQFLCSEFLLWAIQW